MCGGDEEVTIECFTQREDSVLKQPTKEGHLRINVYASKAWIKEDAHIHALMCYSGFPICAGDDAVSRVFSLSSLPPVFIKNSSHGSHVEKFIEAVKEEPEYENNLTVWFEQTIPPTSVTVSFYEKLKEFWTLMQNHFLETKNIFKYKNFTRLISAMEDREHRFKGNYKGLKACFAKKGPNPCFSWERAENIRSNPQFRMLNYNDKKNWAWWYYYRNDNDVEKQLEQHPRATWVHHSSTSGFWSVANSFVNSVLAQLYFCPDKKWVYVQATWGTNETPYYGGVDVFPKIFQKLQNSDWEGIKRDRLEQNVKMSGAVSSLGPEAQRRLHARAAAEIKTTVFKHQGLCTTVFL